MRAEMNINYDFDHYHDQADNSKDAGGCSSFSIGWN